MNPRFFHISFTFHFVCFVLLIIGLVWFISGCIPIKTNAEAYFELGKKYEAKRHFRKANKAYGRATKLDGSNPMYMVKKAEMCYRAPLFYDSEKARNNVHKYYRRAHKLSPSYEPALYSQAYYYFYLGEYQNSKEYLDTLLAFYPNNHEGHILRGRMLFKRKEFEKGMVDFNTALGMTKDKAPIYLLIADGYYSQKKFLEAKEYYLLHSKGKKMDEYERLANLVICYWKMDRKDSTMHYYRMLHHKHDLRHDRHPIKHYLMH